MSEKHPKSLKPGQKMWLERGLFCRMTATKGLQYGISYRADGRIFREIVGPKKGEARKALAVRQSEIARGKFKIPTRKEAPTVAEVCDRYLEYAKKHKRSWKRDRGVMVHLKAKFGSKRVDKLTAWDIQLFQSDRADKVTKASANRELAIAKRMLMLAVTWGLIDRNPAADVRLFKEDERGIRTLSVEEQQALIGACSSHLRPIVVAALFTGMRRGELFDLDWQNVDLTKGLITVAKSKSGKRRIIPIGDDLRRALRRLPKPHEGYVFHHNGERLTTIQKAFNNAVKRAGVLPCRFHDLRHTFATGLVLDGVDLVTVQQLLGHADIKMTLRYSHPSEEAKRQAIAKLQDRFSKWDISGTGAKSATPANAVTP